MEQYFVVLSRVAVACRVARRGLERVGKRRLEGGWLVLRELPRLNVFFSRVRQDCRAAFDFHRRDVASVSRKAKPHSSGDLR